MTEELVFILALVFVDWDDCVNYASRHRIIGADHFCIEVLKTVGEDGSVRHSDPAPVTSIYPRERPTK